jgi:hypothetical protein
MADVIEAEEKGSDVTSATLLLLDAFEKDCDTAVVVSKDGDLCLPIKLAHTRLRLRVGIVNPHPEKYRSRVLEGDFFKQLKSTAVASSLSRCGMGLVSSGSLQAGNAYSAETRRSGSRTQPPKRLG